MRPALPEVKIETSFSHWDCECCGGVTSGDATLTLPDRTLEAAHDGHFGNGAWRGQDEQLFDWALQALGVEVRVNGAAVDRSPFFEQDSQYEWQPVTLLPLPASHVVELTVVTQPDEQDPQYEVPVSVSWTTRKGQLKTLRANLTGAGEWDGDVETLFETLLQEYCTLEVVRHPAEYD